MELSVGKSISSWEVVWGQRLRIPSWAPLFFELLLIWDHCQLSSTSLFPHNPFAFILLRHLFKGAKTSLDKGLYHLCPFFGSRIYLEAISVGICLKKKNLGWHLWWSKCNSNEAFLHLQHYIFAFRDIKSALARARALLHTRRIFPWAAGWVNKWKVQANLILKKWIRSRLGPHSC